MGAWNFSLSDHLDISQVRTTHKKRNNYSISPSNHVLFCLLYNKQLTNKKSTSFTFQKEKVLLFICGAK